MDIIRRFISLLWLTAYGITGSVNRPSDIYSPNAEWIYVMGGNRAQSAKDTQSTPGPRSRAAGWGDKDGNFWMFGGLGYDSSDLRTAHITNDLWMFNVTDLKWNVVEEPDRQVTKDWHRPSARRGAAMCGVHGIIITIFGGEGLDGTMLDDTWIYDIEKRSWLQLHRLQDSPQNHPSGRVSPSVWCCHDSFIIYGGKNNDQLLSDMWQFSLTNLTWTHLFLSSQTLSPGSRIGATTWTKGSQLWLFGGATTTQKSKDLELCADFWKFSLSTKQWRLLTEGQLTSSVRTNQTESYLPEARKFSLEWLNHDGSLLFLYGGEGHTKLSEFSEESQLFDGLWQYSIKDGKWEKTPFYTVQGKTAHGNSHVLSRSRGNCWVGSYGEFYTFGGLAYDTQGQVRQMNDIWILVPPHSLIPAHFVNISFMAVDHRGASSASEHQPGFVFVMVLLTFGGIVMLVGAIFCMKKMSNYPRHHPDNRFKVKYSKLDKTTDPEDEADQFLLEEPDDIQASFTIVE